MVKKKQQKDIPPSKEAPKNTVEDAENKDFAQNTQAPEMTKEILAKTERQGDKKRYAVFWLGVILLVAGATLAYYYPAVFKNLNGVEGANNQGLSLPSFASASSSGVVDSSSYATSIPASAGAMKKPSKTAVRMAELEDKMAALEAQVESQATGGEAGTIIPSASVVPTANEGWKAMAEKLESELAETKENLAEVKNIVAGQRAKLKERQALAEAGAALKKAVYEGKDFTQELVKFETLMENENNADFASKVQDDVANLVKFLPRVMTAKELRLAFPTLVENARHAPLGGVASDDFTTRVIDKMKSLVVVQKIGTEESSSLTGAASPDAIFAKAEKLVEKEDFAGAGAVLVALPPQMHLSFAKWEEDVNILNLAKISADNLFNKAVADLVIDDEKLKQFNFSDLPSNQL